VHDRSTEAQGLRREATQDADPRVAATAQVAQWLAGDALDASDLEAKLEQAAWPLGPVAAFLLASRPPEDRAHDSVCASRDAAEPVTRVNLFIAATRNASSTMNARCVDLARLASTLEHARPWPLRLAAGRALLSTQPSPADARADASAIPMPADARDAASRTELALERCRARDPHPTVREACGGTVTPSEHDRALFAAPLALPYRALVFEDGRVLISAVDAAGDSAFPGLDALSEENPWQWPYARE
jgi:hypothetical protein